MKKKDVILGVGAALEAAMRQEGFSFAVERGSGLFSRRQSGAVQGFSLHSIQSRHGSVPQIECGISLRFDAIEELLRPHLTKNYGGVAPPADKVTVGEALWNLYSRFDFVTRWWQLRVADEGDFSKVGRRVQRDFRKYALPWFEIYETVDRLEAAYQGPKASWPSGRPSDRFQLLLAIAVLRGDRAGFEELAAEALARGPRGEGALAIPDIVEGLRSELDKRP